MKRISDLLWPAAFGGLLIYLAFTVWLALSGLVYPYQLDYGEGAMLEQARLLSQGQSIYKGLEGYPYAFSNYPPLLQTLAALLIPFLGVTYATGRLWNVLALFSLGLVLYRVVQSQTRDRRAAAVAALAFLGAPYIYHWSPLFRIDLPALFFSALGVAVIGLVHARSGLPNPAPRAAGSPDPAGAKTGNLAPYLAAILFVLSLYTKHSFLAAPMAAFFYLWLQRRTDALKLLATMLLVGGGLFWWINFQTAGAFYFDLITTNVNPFDLSGLLSQMGDFFATFAVIILLAGYAFIARLRACSAQCSAWAQGRNIGPGQRLLFSLSVWDWYFLAAVATIALAGKIGSWENYFFEPLLVLCLYAGLGLGRLAISAFRFPIVAPALLLLQVALMFHTPAIAYEMMRDDGIANQKLSPIIANTPGPIISEDMGLLVTNGKEIGFFGFEYTQLARMGLWDQAWELDMLRRRRFPLVILEAGTRENPERYYRFTRQVLSELDRNYALAEEIGKYRLYRPSPLRREMAVDFGEKIALLGYRLDVAGKNDDLTGIHPGDTLAVGLLWQARQAMPEGYTVFVHLLDAQGKGWAQHDGAPFGGVYPTQRWETGELVRDTHVLTLPTDLPAGRYVLRVGLYASVTGERLPLSTGGDNLPLASLRVGPAPVSSPAHAITARLGDAISLLGYDLTKPAAPSSLNVTLYWQTQAYVDSNYTVLVHLLGADGKPVAQGDSQPEGGAYPTSLWEPGDTVRDEHTVALPDGLPPGEYRLAVGLYLLATGQRLSVATGGDQVILGTVIR